MIPHFLLIKKMFIYHYTSIISFKKSYSKLFFINLKMKMPLRCINNSTQVGAAIETIMDPTLFSAIFIFLIIIFFEKLFISPKEKIIFTKIYLEVREKIKKFFLKHKP
jgi:hypothetical protein